MALATTSVSRQWPGLRPLLFTSGAVALVYEVLWFRLFNFLFGSAAAASAAILVAYFAGLGIGSILFGRLVGRWKNPLRAYAGLELGIGLSALLVPSLLSGLSELIAGRTLAPGTEYLAKGLAGFVAVAMPTILMGGTIPVLAEFVDRWKEHPGNRVGWLYEMNTAGAAAGALAFPLVLLPTLGMQLTTILCAVANAGVAGAAHLMSRREVITDGQRRSPAARRKGGQRQDIRPFVLAFVSGAGAFALQVLWNRAFAQVHENSLYSFALIATAFILAIAAGTELARRALRPKFNRSNAFAFFWAAGGIAVLVSIPLFLKLCGNLQYLPVSSATGRLMFMMFATIIGPVTLLSAGLPMLIDEAVQSSDKPIGSRTGHLLGVNILGAICGSILAGFVTPGGLGVWNSLRAVGLIYLFCAAFVKFPAVGPRLISAAALVFIGFVLLKLDAPRTRLDSRSGERLLALREGPHGIVAVTARGNSRRLKLNNHYLLGGTSSMGDERMQAHLPLLLHPAPERVAFLGYGTGITAGAALLHPGVHATGIEIVPEVAGLATTHFADANLGFGRTGDSVLLVKDARDYLRAPGSKLDVIIGDLVVPWRPGEASLYTREHFAAVRAALNRGGVFCVWLPMFQLSQTQFNIILNTFLEEFGRALVWRGDFSPTEPALALIGRTDGDWDFATMAARLRQLKPDPANPQLAFEKVFWMHLVGHLGPELLDASERHVNSENRPWLELRETSAATHFVGRALQGWEQRVRQAFRPLASQMLSEEAQQGWAAGARMVEFTLAAVERNQAAAATAREQVRSLLGEEAYRAVFGPQP